MKTTIRLFLSVGGVAAMTAVALGAFGAHALKEQVRPELMAVYQTAVLYHISHALGLLFVGLTTIPLAGSRLLIWAGVLMIAGILLFCGSLYALALTGMNSLGAITPFGGLAFLGAWTLFTAAVVRHRAHCSKASV